MVKTAGRECVIKIAAAVVAGARVTGLNRSSTPIDVSDADDNEYLAFLADLFSEDTLEITLSGVEDGTVLRDLAFSTTASDRHLSDLTFEFPGTPLDSISGSFIMTSFTLGGDYKEATTFDVTFMRTGQHTYTQG